MPRISGTTRASTRYRTSSSCRSNPPRAVHSSANSTIRKVAKVSTGSQALKQPLVAVVIKERAVVKNKVVMEEAHRTTPRVQQPLVQIIMSTLHTNYNSNTITSTRKTTMTSTKSSPHSSMVVVATAVEGISS